MYLNSAKLASIFRVNKETICAEERTSINPEYLLALSQVLLLCTVLFLDRYIMSHRHLVTTILPLLSFLHTLAQFPGTHPGGLLS